MFVSIRFAHSLCIFRVHAIAAFSIFLLCQSLFLAGSTQAQVLNGLGRGQDALGINSRISEQRVLRQTEVMRLEQLIDGIGKRVNRMERQLFANSRFPAITVSEAEAALVLAET